jgi:hypothetical protein
MKRTDFGLFEAIVVLIAHHDHHLGEHGCRSVGVTLPDLPLPPADVITTLNVVMAGLDG